MPNLSPEDSKACGLERESDAGWEPAARILGTFAASMTALAVGGPVAFIATTAYLTEKIYQGRDKQ